MLVSREAYIQGRGAYIRDFAVYETCKSGYEKIDAMTVVTPQIEFLSVKDGTKDSFPSILF